MTRYFNDDNDNDLFYLYPAVGRDGESMPCLLVVQIDENMGWM